MDWTVEIHRDEGGDAKMIDLPNFEAVLACIKEHKEKGFLGTIGVHAQVQPTDEERVAVVTEYGSGAHWQYEQYPEAAADTPG